MVHSPILSASTNWYLCWAGFMPVARDTKANRPGWKATCALSPMFPLHLIKVETFAFIHPFSLCREMSWWELWFSTFSSPLPVSSFHLIQLVSLDLMISIFLVVRDAASKTLPLPFAIQTLVLHISFPSPPSYYDPSRAGLPCFRGKAHHSPSLSNLLPVDVFGWWWHNCSPFLQSWIAKGFGTHSTSYALLPMVCASLCVLRFKHRKASSRYLSFPGLSHKLRDSLLEYPGLVVTKCSATIVRIDKGIPIWPSVLCICIL